MNVSIDVRHAGLPGIGRFARELASALHRRAQPDDAVLSLRRARPGGWLGRESLGPVEEGRGGGASITILSPPLGGLDEAELAVRLRHHHVGLHHSTHLSLPRLAGVPVVLTVHDVFPLTEPNHARSPLAAAYYRLALPWAVRHAAAVVAVSDYTADQVETVLGRRPEAVIAHGVDHAAWRCAGDAAGNAPSEIAGDPAPNAPTESAGNAAITAPTESVPPRPYLLYVGTAKRHKNLATLLLAHAGARDDRGHGLPELVLAGPTRAELQANGVTVGPGVTVLGRVADGRLPSLYSGAAAVAVPSRYEGFGLTALEAMAFGAPVVVADSPGLRDTVGDAAALVPPDEPAAWADALARAAADPALRAALIERGRQRAARYRWDDAADSYLALYREVLSR